MITLGDSPETNISEKTSLAICFEIIPDSTTSTNSAMHSGFIFVSLMDKAESPTSECADNSLKRSFTK